MKETFDLQDYLIRGVERVVAGAMKATLKDPRESAYMIRFAAASKAASKRRKGLEKESLHVPPFLIASITSACNLHCAGCYSRCNEATTDDEPAQQLTGNQWLRIFEEAEELGVSFILLAGGEPLLRRDVIEAAAKKPSIMFSHDPCFGVKTNSNLPGTVARYSFVSSDVCTFKLLGGSVRYNIYC